MPFYSIEGRRFSEDDPGLQPALARVHRTATRPLCLCSRPGVPMYVARVDGRFHIKRMPDSGATHSADCPSYEPPAALSGLGEVMGHAIKEDVADGITTLRLDFALNKIAGRQPPAPSTGDQDSIKADTSRLSIRALLHFLWDAAHLTHWHPAMTGRRNWATVHKYLTQAAQGKVTKGIELPRTLYVPEPFYLDRNAEIAQRRNALFASSVRSGQPGQKLFIVIGELKSVSVARFGWKLILKQASDFPFMISEDVNKKLKVFRNELDLWNAFEADSHLILIATFSVSPAGVAQVEEMALMVTNQHWLPFSSTNEKALLDSLIASNRRFVKGLRYNLSGGRPLASVFVTDTEPLDTAVYLIPGNRTETFQAALNEFLEDDKLTHILWEEGGLMPEIPPAATSRHSEPIGE